MVMLVTGYCLLLFNNTGTFIHYTISEILSRVKQIARTAYRLLASLYTAASQIQKNDMINIILAEVYKRSILILSSTLARTNCWNIHIHTVD